MTTLDVKGVIDLIKSIGPTEEHRQQLSRTFVGTLLGQATALILMLLAYFLAVVLLYRYFKDDLRSLQSDLGAVGFWIAMALPFVCILLFSMLPTLWRARREHNLKQSVIAGEPQFAPRHFRLHPYGAADSSAYKRLDGADTMVLNWLQSAKSTLLYLTGASGVGKSSLLAASVLPKLREQGWAVIEARPFGDPMERLREAVLGTKGLFARKPAGEWSLRELLEKPADARAKSRAKPVALVIDQFEEFLILNTESERRAFAEFLDDLVKNPVAGLRLVLVFRSDYRPLVFKLELPPLRSVENWQELAPYDRGEAVTFLQSGGRQLPQQALDSLFAGLDRIEEARGLYRPITLNMVGLVLERMGSTIEGDPGRLIQSYLTGCLTSGESRDYAKRVLAAMITDAGTKEPHTEAELATLTGLESWQVRATLADLASKGLVRRLEGATAVWEIAHDFLARTIGQLIGRLKPPLRERARPLLAPLVLLGWVSLAVLAVPSWLTAQERASERILRGLAATFTAADSGGIRVAFSLQPTNNTLVAARPHLAVRFAAARSLARTRLLA